MNSVRRDMVVIGGSAGALDPLVRLLDGLPGGFSASVFVTLHIPPDHPSLLPQLLSKRGHRIARHPVENEKPQPGVVYVAPPDAHLLVDRGRLLLGHGARENRHRPAIDVMFRSAARAYGGRVAAIVLSGQLDDGAAGLIAVKIKRGLTIVQDPNEATAPELPCRAIQYANPDHVLPIGEIAKLLGTVINEVLSLPQSLEVPVCFEDEVKKAIPKGSPSAFACPECHGVLWELEQGQLLRFRCRLGHAYTADALRVALSE